MGVHLPPPSTLSHRKALEEERVYVEVPAPDVI
jgi:hypothetical protein